MELRLRCEPGCGPLRLPVASPLPLPRLPQHGKAADDQTRALPPSSGHRSPEQPALPGWVFQCVSRTARVEWRPLPGAHHFFRVIFLYSYLA